MSELVENKQIFTHKGLSHFALKHAVEQDYQRRFLGTVQWNKIKANVQTVADRSYTALEKQFHAALKELVARPLADAAAKKVFTEFYAKAYTLGLKASGAGISQGFSMFREKSMLPIISVQERQWAASAAMGEFKYWKNFMRDIVEERLIRFSVEQRIGMYVSSLSAQYDAGRVAGAPENSLIHWVTSKQEKCPSCLYLASLSPFPKEAVVVVPKSSFTSCRVGCNCKLRIVAATPDEYKMVRAKFPPKTKVIYRLRRLFNSRTSYNFDRTSNSLKGMIF